MEEEDDINQITDYFSYEHFYVIYCKFWELDTDHDLYISQKDLARYSDQGMLPASYGGRKVVAENRMILIKSKAFNLVNLTLQQNLNGGILLINKC